MEWQAILNEAIISIVGLVVSALGALLIKWVSSKIKNEKLNKLINDAYTIVSNGVSYVYQTYVENRKGTDLWDQDAMDIAKQQAVDYIKNHLTQDMIKCLNNSDVDLEQWIKEQIEIAIQKSKENRS